MRLDSESVFVDSPAEDSWLAQEAAFEAQRRAEAQAEEQARLASEAAANAQFEAARAAAEAQEAGAPQMMLPVDDEALGQSVIALEPGDAETGAYAQDLERRLAGGAVPEELQLAVEHLRVMAAQADALDAQGFHDQAAAMGSAMQEVSASITTSMTTAPVVVDEPSAPAGANDYFTGSFDVPPPGGWFWSIGDTGRTGQEGGVYQWLPEVVAIRAEASEHGAYLLAASGQVTTVAENLADAAVYPITFEIERGSGEGLSIDIQTRMLSRDESAAELHLRGMDENAIAAYLAGNERYMVTPGYNTGGDGGTEVAPVYGTRDDYLSAIGLGAGVPMDLQIAFNNSLAQSGDAWLDTSHPNQSMTTGGVEKAYVAIVDDKLAGDWVQLGDIGPLNDDVNEMLGEIYTRYGATTLDQQEAIRGILFKYDERFGVLGNRELIEAAVDKNNDRRQGFFEGPLGRTLLTVAASFIPGAGPYVAIMLNAGFQLSDGASFGQVIAGAAVSYFTQQYSPEFGDYVAGAFGDTISPAVAEVIAAGAGNLGSAAVRQLVSGEGLDPKGLLLAAASGGFGSFISTFVEDSDFGAALDAQFGRFRASDILTRLAGAVVDGKLSASEFAAAFAAGRADRVTSVDGTDGRYVFAETGDGVVSLNPDGTINVVGVRENGDVVSTVYGSDGNEVVTANAFTGKVAPTIVGTPLDDDGNLNPGFAAFATYDFLEMPPASADVYAFWRSRGAERGLLVGADVPDDVAAVAQASTVRVGIALDGNPYFALSGALARVQIDGQERIVMFTVMHGIGSGAYGTTLQSPQGTRELGEGGFSLVAQTSDGRTASIPLDDVMTNFRYNDRGEPVFVQKTNDIMAANITDGLAVILPPETAALLVNSSDLALLPALSQETLAANAAAYQFGYPGFTEPAGGPSTSADLRLLTGSTRDVTMDQNNQLIATGVTSETNPPQSFGSSGGPLYARDASGNVVLVGVTSLMQGTSDPNAFTWAYSPIRGLPNGFYLPPRRP